MYLIFHFDPPALATLNEFIVMVHQNSSDANGNLVTRGRTDLGMGDTAAAKPRVLLARQTHLLWAALSALLIACGAAGAAVGSSQVTVPPFSAEGAVSTKVFF